MITASNIKYELADRVQGLACGGIGAMLLVARKTGLVGDVDSPICLVLGTLPGHPGWKGQAPRAQNQGLKDQSGPDVVVAG
jgi:hypothetical protein